MTNTEAAQTAHIPNTKPLETKHIPNYRDNEILIYDMEVFAQDWIIVFQNTAHEVVKVFYCSQHEVAMSNWERCYTTDNSRIADFIKGKTLVGFNNYSYDDKMLSAMIRCEDVKSLKTLSDHLVGQTPVDIAIARKTWSELRNYGTVSLDTKSQTPVGTSLKKIEAGLGMDIQETKIDFNLKRALTKAELLDTFKYCSHDTMATGITFLLREPDYFAPKQVLVEHIFNQYPVARDPFSGDVIPETVELPPRAKTYRDSRGKTTTKQVSPQLSYIQLIAYNVPRLMGIIVLADKPNEHWDSFRLDDIAAKAYRGYHVKNRKLNPVAEMWDAVTFEPNGFRDDEGRPFDIVNKPIKGASVTKDPDTYDYGFGGLHAIPKQKHLTKANGKPAGSYVGLSERVHNFDITSMYPNTLILMNAFGAATEQFKQIVDIRVNAKREGNKRLAGGLKIGVNATFGGMINKHLALYNPFAGVSVCMYGQIALTDLITKLLKVKGVKLVQGNTDGVAFTSPTESDPEWRTVIQKWQDDWKFNLEEDYFPIFYQKAVNDYVATHKDGTIKGKGPNAAQYYAPEPFKSSEYRILQLCLVQAIVYKRSPLYTIMDNLKHPELFMQVTHAGAAFDHVADENGNKLPYKTNRLFAVKQEYADYMHIYKVRADGSRISFGSTPMYFKTHNEDISTYTNFEKECDIQHYINLANDLLLDWGISTTELREGTDRSVDPRPIQFIADIVEGL